MTVDWIRELVDDAFDAADGEPGRDRIAVLLERAARKGADKSRDDLAEGLLSLLFALRPGDTAEGRAWCATVASTALARAILGAIGPREDAEPMIQLAIEDVRTSIKAAQSAAARSLILGRGPRRQM